MAGRFSRSLELARASWSVVSADKELLLFPVFSACALLLIVGSVAVPVLALGRFSPESMGQGAYLGAFVFYVLAYFIGLFFNTALVGAAMIRMDGGNPTLKDGLSIAWARIGKIFAYAVIAATVGLFLRAIEERVGWLGQIVVRLLGVAWALATFMVVPVLVSRDVGPVDAVKESASLLRETWGENLIGNAGLSLVFGVAYFVTLVVGAVGVYLGVVAQLPLVVAVVILVGVIALLLLTTLQATMQGV
ncbi:MAG TPA: DUF6159 family protein, partial [Steroidobacteraceae bacterium]